MSKKLCGMLLSSIMLFSNLTTIQVYAEEDTNTGDENTQEVTETEDDRTEKKGETEIINSEEETGEEVTVDTEQTEETEIEEEYPEEKEQQNTDGTENIVVSDEQEEEIESKETNTEEEIIETEEDSEEKEEPSDAVVLEGQAYAVLEDDGDMIFFRSNESYTNKTTGTFKDIKGTEYTGTVYSGFESASYSSSTAVPWNSDKRSIYTVTVASEQTIKPNSTAYWFYNCNKLTNFDGSGFNTSNVTNMSYMFSEDSNLTSLDVSGFETSNVTNMSFMFSFCSNLTSLDVSGFETSNVTDMITMFNGCSKLTSLDVSGFDTSNVTSMGPMFRGCSSLTSLDVNGFDTSKVQHMGGMFENCRNLTSLDLSNFDTSNVTNMLSMFSGCNNLISLDLSSFDTNNVKSMQNMFYSCSSLLDVKLGKGFTKWSDQSLLPSGSWSNRVINISLTSIDLCNQYPQNAESYAGTWLKNAIIGITVSPETIILPINETQDLDVEISPASATNKTVTWTSSDESVATVDENGRITAVRLGTATITAITEDGGYTATCEVTVVQPVTGITLDKEEITINVNETAKLTASIIPEDAGIKTVIWSSDDESVATVDNTGKVAAVGRGTVTITATTEDGGYTATCEVTVIQSVTGMTLDKEELIVGVNLTAELIATVEPENANNKNVTWTSSDESVATVDESGRITAVRLGTATITAITEDGGYTATCEVTVVQPVTGITLDIEEITLNVNETSQLTASIIPEDASIKKVIWSSRNNSVATVDNNGKITAIGRGTVTITATTEDGGYTATCEVTVIQPVTGIILDKEKITLNVSETAELAATLKPDNANNRTVTWISSDYSVASVNRYGKITAVGRGTARITATTEDGGYTATCDVTVIQPVAGITLDKEELTINVNNALTLTATVKPENANNKIILWSTSDNSVVTVNRYGRITAVGRGIATITATTEDGGYTATCEVTVIQPVTGINLDKEEITVNVNETAKLSATVKPENANNKTITWTSSDRNIATVDANGKITALRPGTATITATTEDGRFAATCEVTIIIKPESIELETDSYQLYVGDAIAIHPTLLPEDAATTGLVYISSDPNVVEVSSDGIVEAISKGTASITVKDTISGLNKRITVTVMKRNGGGVIVERNCKTLQDELFNNNTELSDGSYKYFYFKNDTQGTIQVYKSNPNFFIFTAGYYQNLDHCNITLEYDASEGTANITIDAMSVYNMYDAALSIDDVYSFDALKDHNYMISDIKYGSYSSNYAHANNMQKVAFKIWNDTLKDMGLSFNMLGLGFGSDIYSPGVYPSIKSVTVDKTNVELFVGETENFIIIPYPADGTPDNIQVVNNDPNIVELYGSGEFKISIKAIAQGTATIDVNVLGIKSETILITVNNPVEIQNKDINLLINDREKIIVKPSNYKQNQLIWSTDNPSVVSVDQSGEITANKEGTAVITVMTNDKLFSDQCIVTVVKKIHPSSVLLDKETMPLRINETFRLFAVVRPDNASNKNIIWTSENYEVASVNSAGRVTGIKPGVTNITATTEDGGYTDSCKVTVLFDDVTNPEQYYYNAVYWAVENNITQGMGPTTFNPGGFCKRYQFVLFLWRQAGCPEPRLKLDPFTDVLSDPKKDVYEKAVLWAVDKEITTGTTPTTFDPYAPLTRGQVVTFLYRAAGQPFFYNWNNPFVDLDSSKYYYIPVLWAVENEITTGLNATQFGPTDTCTRGQTVTFLHRQFVKE